MVELEGSQGLLLVLEFLEVAQVNMMEKGRLSPSEYVEGFSSFLGVQSSLVAEFIGAIIALKEAQKFGYRHLSMECDSSLVCPTFSSKSLVPWSLHNRWNKGLFFCKGIDFKISHIFRKGNHYANKLVSLGLLNRLEFV